MNEPQDDRELDRYLDGDSPESREYARLGDETAPPEVDARILAEAERAVKVTRLQTHKAPPFKAFAWAAIVVLSFSLVLNLVFEQAVQDPAAQLEQMSKESAAPASPAPEAKKSEPAFQADDARLERSRMAANADRPAEALEETESVGSSYGMQSEDDEAMLDALVRQDAPAVAGRAAAPEPADISGLMSSLGEADSAVATPDQALRIVADYLVATEGSGSLTAMQSGGVRDAKYDDGEANAALTRIVELYDDGRSDEALAALAEFRDEYPDHPVSVEIAERGW